MSKRRIASYIVAAVLAVGLAVALGFAAYRQKRYVNELENLYEKSYYNTLDAVGNLEVNLSKLQIAVNGEELQELLKNVWRDSSVAESNLSQLAGRDDSIESIIKFINQLGDYCYYLSLKVEGGASISEEESENLAKSLEVVTKMQEALYEVQGKIEEGQKLMGKFNKDLNFLSAAVTKINASTLEYPGLIYDGPFSDGLNERDPVAIQDLEEISAEDARAKVNDYFSGKQIENLTQTGEVGGNIPSYIFSFSVNGKDASVYISKKGGKVVLYDAFKEVNAVNYGEDECVEIAEQFVADVGYSDMTPVWVNNNNSTIYINFAYKRDDVVVYCDLIKVKVEAASGEIIGLEAQNYIYNHKDRNYTPSKTAEEAREKVSPKVTVKEERLAVIPTEWNTEILVYEFMGEYKERTYFIYVNADTLRGEGILEVIEDSGKLVV
ncbi:MAG: PepSY1/2 domain-containing protein [Christensenellales bacterium]|jgi:spore germination protein